MLVVRVVLKIFVLVGLIHFCHCYLYAEDVGKNDWLKENIGNIEHVHFGKGSTRINVHVSTSSNVLAALSKELENILEEKDKLTNNLVRPRRNQ